LASSIETPAWTNDYEAARRLGAAHDKPLAVFIGSGKGGWNQVAEEGQLGKEVSRLLSANYVCVYLDTAQERGKSWAAKFDVSDGPGIVVSDHSGSLQAFRHEGELAANRLKGYLAKYSDPERAVNTTETDRPPRVSYYYPASEFSVQPNTFYRGGFAGRSC
jgi:hypothetical protein